jgi:hypothetical protein
MPWRAREERRTEKPRETRTEKRWGERKEKRWVTGTGERGEETGKQQERCHAAMAKQWAEVT